MTTLRIHPRGLRFIKKPHQTKLMLLPPPPTLTLPAPYKRKSDPKFLQTKFFLTRNLSGPELFFNPPKIIKQTIFSDPKICLQPKNFRTPNFLNFNFSLTVTLIMFLDPAKFFHGQKVFLANILAPNFIYPKLFWNQNVSGPKIFGPKLFWTKNSYGPKISIYPNFLQIQILVGLTRF